MVIKTCEKCHEEFLAKTTRAKLCGLCYSNSRRADRHGGRRTPTFRAVDGEGIGDKYVLLGVGQDQKEWENGVEDITEIFDYLYQDFLLHPDAYYVGFYLGYDWNNWFKLLPYNRVAYLLDPKYIAKRQRRMAPHSPPFPVSFEGWEFDWLPGKRFKLRPDSTAHNYRWMYLCDTGGFFQMSLLKALHGRSPNSEITDEQVERIREGKEKRSTAVLDDDMRFYNRLENYALENLLLEVDHSLSVLGTPLGKTEYHGPGQAAQKWILKQTGIEESNDAIQKLPEEIYSALVASYYGGIFEITAHGHVPGTTYEYDINSAYPYQISKLPCVCGNWVRASSVVASKAKLTLVHGRFRGSNQWLGPLPFRTPERGILRPREGSGWYWDFEIAAAMRAGLLDSFEPDDYVVYLGCEHGNLLDGIRHLYDERLRVGKDTAVGKGCKLVYNSAYGKNAQSVGDPQCSNPVYASLITAGCRAMILDAIATHPQGANALLMIATDAVFFTSAHPTLPLSNKLGEWDVQERENLCIFKPGMYWDDRAREAIALGDTPVFKARGVNARDFADNIAKVDSLFAIHAVTNGDWPTFKMPVRFAQISVKQAYQRSRAKPLEEAEVYFRLHAGRIITDMEVKQSSDPSDKRNTQALSFGLHVRSEPYQGNVDTESTPYDKRFGRPENPLEEYVTEELTLDAAIAEALQLK